MWIIKYKVWCEFKNKKRCWHN